MYLITGLGNPGEAYRGTRHNVGFDVIDLLAAKYNISMNRIKFKGVYGEGFIETEKVILLKPSTYMNLSGESVSQALDYYKIPQENIIVIHDDMSLEYGRLRIRNKGSAGGHNGIKNIIFYLASDVFIRIKIGIGSPKHGDAAAYVLGRFTEEEKNILNKVYDVSLEVVETILGDGTEAAMNKFNGFRVSSEEKLI